MPWWFATLPTLTYVSGFDGVWDAEPYSVLLLTPGDALVITDSRFRESAEKAAAGSSWVVVTTADEPARPRAGACD